MNKKMKMLGVSMLSLIIAITGVANGNTASNDQDGNSKPTSEVNLRVSSGTTHTKKHVPLRITFTNISYKKIRLLNTFKPVSNFFNITLKTISDKPIHISKSVIKPNLILPTSLKTLELKPNESFTTYVDVSEFIPSNLEEGLYVISVSYHNDYRKDCLKSAETSEGVWITINDVPVVNVPGSIVEKEAVQLAKAAIVGKFNLRPNEKISVRNTAKQYIVTFGEPPRPRPGYIVTGGDFAAQVRVNRLTGVVEKILGGG